MVAQITKRPVAVAATLGGSGQGRVAALSGAEAGLAGLAADEGFTPLEFLDAALSGCLVLSLRIAARQPENSWRSRSPNDRYSETSARASPSRSPYGGLQTTRPEPVHSAGR